MENSTQSFRSRAFLSTGEKMLTEKSAVQRLNRGFQLFVHGEQDKKNKNSSKDFT